MDRQRAGGRPARGVLGDTQRRPEHPKLPPPPRACEAIGAQPRQFGEGRQVRLERRDRRLAGQRDEGVLGTVPIGLDGERRCLHAERGQQLGRARIWLPFRYLLLHPAESDPPGFAIEGDRNHTEARLEPDDGCVCLLGQHEGRAEDRVTREGKLGRGSEDPDAHVAAGFRRKREDRLGEVHLPGEGLEQLAGIRSASVKTASWLPVSGRSV